MSRAAFGRGAAPASAGPPAGRADARDGPPLPLPGRLLIALIGLWQVSFSAVMAPSCRFSPSCSGYAAEAIRRHGVARGVLLALRRLARCHPWGGHGLDPVPDRRA